MINEDNFLILEYDTYDKIFSKWAIKTYGKAANNENTMKIFDTTIGLVYDATIDTSSKYLGFRIESHKKLMIARLQYAF